MNSNIAPDPPHFARVGSVHGAPFRSDQSAPRGRPSFARRRSVRDRPAVARNCESDSGKPLHAGMRLPVRTRGHRDGTGMKRHKPEWRTGIRPNPLCSCNPASGEWPLILPEKWGGRLRMLGAVPRIPPCPADAARCRRYKHEHRVPLRGCNRSEELREPVR